MNFRHLIFLLTAVIAIGCSPAEKPAGEPVTTTEYTPPAGRSGAYVVYINADTLLSRYDYFRREMEKLEAREKEVSTDLNQRNRALEQEYRGIQQKIQEGLLAPNQIAKEEQRLALAQQKLLAERERLSQELLAETDKLNKELRSRLDSLLRRLQQENGYDFVLQYGQGSNVLMVNDSLDITGLVLSELNREESSTTTD